MVELSLVPKVNTETSGKVTHQEKTLRNAACTTLAMLSSKSYPAHFLKCFKNRQAALINAQKVPSDLQTR